MSPVVRSSHCAGVHALPVPQDRDPFADREDLRDPVGDVDDGHAAFGEPLEHLEQVFRLGGRQRRRRLVEDEDARLAGHGTGDLDELAQGDRQAGDGLVQVDPDPDLVEGGLCDVTLLSAVDEPRGLGRGEPEQDVLGDGHLRDQAQLLVDQGDPGFERSLGAAHLQWLAIDEDGALGRLEDPRQHPHQGRLARAVLADDRVDLPGQDLDVDAIHSNGTAEALDELAPLDDRRGRLLAAGLVDSICHGSASRGTACWSR